MNTKLSEPVIRGILREAQRAHDHTASELMRVASRHLRAATAIASRLAETTEQPAQREDSAA